MRTRPVSRAAAIRALDAALIEEVGIPSAVLMEHAGHLVAAEILRRWGPVATTILCGPGNNGGDGYVIARHLALAGAPVRAVAVLPPRSEDCEVFHGVASALGLVAEDVGRPALVVDAIFGTGQRAPLALPALPELEAALRGGAALVAVDVPTGVDADTGLRVGDFPEPDLTITIGRLKPCLFAPPRPHVLVDIGLEWRGTEPDALLLEGLPPWPFAPGANKWDRGHVGVLAGSAEKTGAAVLACRGALRGGAGLVTLFLVREAWSRLGALPPEVMVAEPGQEVPWDALVAGPGLGRVFDAELRRIWSEERRPCVFDADAIRALDGSPSAHPRLLTPHAGEAAHLLGEEWRALEADRLETAGRLGAIAPTIYKGGCPVVTGAVPVIIPGGSPQAGTGGSGDVLAGLCGAMLARGRPASVEAIEALAVRAAWLHQVAAALAGPVGITAGDIADAIPRAVASLG
jgi:hydroxyethylthiazole kinase-like uncharacterized protein yjeF